MMMFNPAHDRIKVELIYNDGDFIGVNLMLVGIILGTFDSLLEAMNERHAIMNFPFDVCYVSGYSEWDG
jgi:hypothetical protein